MNDYDHPWQQYVLTSVIGQWFVMIAPGEEDETPAEEMMRAYEMAWFSVQISQGATTLVPTCAQAVETDEGWGIWRPESA